jgi:hypothetical protein
MFGGSDYTQRYNELCRILQYYRPPKQHDQINATDNSTHEPRLGLSLEIGLKVDYLLSKAWRFKSGDLQQTDSNKLAGKTPPPEPGSAAKIRAGAHLPHELGDG